MSSLTKPGGAGGIGGTPVDPIGPEGILIDPYTEIGYTPALGEVIKGNGLGGWTVGAPDYAGVVYKGVWNATTNAPDLPAATPAQGDYYIVSVAGTTSLGGITDWGVGDWAIFIGSAWQKVDNSEPNVVLLEFSTVLGVPNGGTRYLDRAGVPCTAVPVLLPAATIVRGLTIIVGNADASRDYVAEVVTDPAGSPTAVADLALAATNVSNTRRDLAVTISAGTVWGVRVRRTSSTGP